MTKVYTHQILKYTIPILDLMGKSSALELPVNGRCVHIHIDKIGIMGKLSFWYELAICDGKPTSIFKSYHFRLFMTGEDLSPGDFIESHYIKTFPEVDGQYVLHLYQLKDFADPLIPYISKD